MRHKPAHRSQGPSLVSLEMNLEEAEVYSHPDVQKSQMDVDEQLDSSSGENGQKRHRWISPFAGWMGQPFPDEYKEMVEADARRG